MCCIGFTYQSSEFIDYDIKWRGCRPNPDVIGSKGWDAAAVPNVDMPVYIEIGLFSTEAEHPGSYVFKEGLHVYIYKGVTQLYALINRRKLDKNEIITE